jgi:hypothetical protein
MAPETRGEGYGDGVGDGRRSESQGALESDVGAARLQVEPFARFEELIREYCSAPADWLVPRQVTYLRSYLSGFPEARAQTIVVERDHTDRHYLDEYTAYYATLLSPPAPRCTRLHIFHTSLTDASFDEAIARAAEGKLDEVQSELSAAYLGYLTVRPMSGAPIGRTVLRHYGVESRRRYQPVIRRCKARIAGLELSLDALPFFQQDRGVGACATTALWSALAGAARNNGMRAPTPYAVTAAATKSFVTDRALPATSGLELAQLAGAMREHGLSPYTVKVDKECDLFLWTLKTYLQSGIPALLYLQANGEGHAVVVAGYKEASSETIGFELSPGRAIRTRGIERIYVHDDRIGPYVRMTLAWEQAEEWNTLTLRRVIADDPKDEAFTRNAQVSYAIYPLYPKLRMSAADLTTVAAQVSPIFRVFLGGDLAENVHVQTWFALNGDYLRNLFQLQPDSARLTRFVTRLRPSRYVGIARYFLGDEVLADVICDTTDIHREDRPYSSVIGVFFMNAKHASTGAGYQSMMPGTLLG